MTPLITIVVGPKKVHAVVAGFALCWILEARDLARKVLNDVI